MKGLQKQLQTINKKIQTINEKYRNAEEIREIGSYERELIENLNNTSHVLDLHFRAYDIPNEFVPKDAVIDVFITYNSLDTKMAITPPPNTTLYPLGFPYLGVKGPRGEIEQIFTDYFGKTATALLTFVLGNEPIEIEPWEFKATSILKPAVDFDGEGTLIGIIDTGIDYTNPAFIKLNGETKIVSIWDQTIGVDSPYGYGTVYNQEAINAALKSPDPFAVIPHKDDWGHGTMLAGIAAGLGTYEKGEYKGIAPGAELVIVKLKPAGDTIQTIMHGSYNPLGFSSLDVALAHQYMVNIANQVQKPISICLASGTNSGSHDGTGILDSIISRYSSNPGICTVISVGEEANKEHHASGNLNDAKEQKIKLTIAKGEEGFVAEIWAMFGDQIQVLLTPPKIGVDILPDMVLNQGQTYRVTQESSVWSSGVRFNMDNGSQVIRFRFEKPVEGQWIITVRGVIVIDGRYNMWIPKTGMILPGTVLSPADPFITISNTSSTDGIIAIGCYDKHSLTACASSGRGFTRDNRVSPDYIAEGIRIPGPLPDNRWGLISGTAPSAAITVGVTSLLYENQLVQEEELANTIVMKAMLVDAVKRQPTVVYPNPSSGYGVIDIDSELS